MNTECPKCGCEDAFFNGECYECPCYDHEWNTDNCEIEEWGMLRIYNYRNRKSGHSKTWWIVGIVK